MKNTLSVVEAAQAFQTANPDIPMVFIPLFDGEAGRGKYPNHPGGHFPDITGGWQKRAITVPWQHPAWAEATGYGIVLTHNQHLVIIDVDNEDRLTLAQQAALQAAPGLTYFTRKGRHHWYRTTPGTLKTMGGKAYTRPWGEMWHHTPRQVAGPGSADKPAPQNLTIPDHIPPIDELLTTTTNLGDWDPAPPEPKGDHDSLRDWIIHQVREGQTDEHRLYLEGKQTDWYENIERKRPRLAQQELQNLINWTLAKGNPQGQPPPTTAPTFEMGELTLLGQEILWDNHIVDHLSGKPVPLNRWQWQTGHPEYLNFYYQQIRIQLPPKITITTAQQAKQHLQSIPPAYQIDADHGDGHIIIGGADETTMLLAQPGQGKTFLALAVVQNLDIPTIYIATESLPSALKRAELLQLNWNNLTITNQPTALHLKELCTQADKNNTQLIVVDVLAPFLDEENSAASWHLFTRYLAPLTAGRSLLICHHTGKNIRLGARGTSAIEAATSYDYLLKADRDPDGDLIIKAKWHRKDKDGHEPTGLAMRIAKHPRWHYNLLPLSREEAADENLIVKAWYAAVNLLPPNKLPSVQKIAEQLDRLMKDLGRKSSTTSARRAVETKLNALFVKVDEAAYNRAPGYTLKDTDNPSKHTLHLESDFGE